MVGEVIGGRYDLEELVGTGGMSSVYRAHDRLLERKVALKILHERLGEDADYVERFRREARAVAQLTHPNIVTVIDRGEDDGRQFIVFEYVDGENLKQLLARTGPLPLRRALELALQVARALAFAHQQGLVHRDIKPQNVLLNGDGRAKVTDFGIARSLDVERGVTQTGTILGTSNYIAPEQASGERVDEQSDVYSLGVVLFELLTARVPFEGENFVNVALRHLNEPPPDVREQRPDVPPRVAALVDALLEKNASARPSMAEVIAELEACLRATATADGADATAILRRPPSARPLRQRPRRRARLGPALLVLALIVVATLAVGAVALLAARDGDDERPAGANPVRLVAVDSFDPDGDGTEHDHQVQGATDGDASTYWSTESYQAGLQKEGVGLVVEALPPREVRSVAVSTSTPGFRAQIRAGASPTGPFDAVSPTKVVDATTTFGLRDATRARYYVVWITDLGGAGSRVRITSLSAASARD